MQLAGRETVVAAVTDAASRSGNSSGSSERCCKGGQGTVLAAVTGAAREVKEQ